jgi:tetratricopeptide (TPR) repeat protein
MVFTRNNSNPGESRPSTTGNYSGVIAALLCGLSFVIYYPSLHGSQLWDDAFHLTAPGLRSLSGLGHIWFQLGATQQYYPVLHSFFWLENLLWGQSVIYYHVTNVILHAFNAYLFFLLLRHLDIKGSCLAAFLFLLHPIGVETVAWISEQKNTLSLLFYLSSALIYFRWIKSGSNKTYALALLFFILALLSKSITATLPCALVVIVMWKEGILSFKKYVLPLTPWIILALISGLFTAWVERHVIGAEGLNYTLSPLARVILSGKIILFYCYKLCWPKDLSFIYSHWTIDADAMGQYAAFFVCLFTLIALIYFRRKYSSSLCAALLFIGTLFPVLGFFNIYPFAYSYVADHFTYHASLAFFAGVSALWASWDSRSSESHSLIKRGLPVILAVSVLSVLATKTYTQAKQYTDIETLYRCTIKTTPDCFLAHNNLGVMLSERGASSEALEHFKAAMLANPMYAQSYKNYADELAKSGGHDSEAVALYNHAILLNPSYPDAHESLANQLSQMPGKQRDAEQEFKTALHLRTTDAKAHNDYAIFLGSLPKRHEEAVVQYLESLKLEPQNAVTHQNLAFEYSKDSLTLKEALTEYTIAIKLDPTSATAHNNLANLLAPFSSQAKEAILHYEAALKLNPNYAEAHNNLGNVLVKDPYRLAEAVIHYKAATRINPSYAEAHFNLGVAYANLGQLQDARTEFQLALKVKPDFQEAKDDLDQLAGSRP